MLGVFNPASLCSVAERCCALRHSEKFSAKRFESIGMRPSSAKKDLRRERTFIPFISARLSAGNNGLVFTPYCGLHKR